MGILADSDDFIQKNTPSRGHFLGLVSIYRRRSSMWVTISRATYLYYRNLKICVPVDLSSQENKSAEIDIPVRNGSVWPHLVDLFNTW